MDSEQYRNVLIAPDRTVEERRLRRKLVESLQRKKRQDEPNRQHFIKANECRVLLREVLVLT